MVYNICDIIYEVHHMVCTMIYWYIIYHDILVHHMVYIIIYISWYIVCHSTVYTITIYHGKSHLMVYHKCDVTYKVYHMVYTLIYWTGISHVIYHDIYHGI